LEAAVNTTICRDLDMTHPIFGFSHCRDVVAAVSGCGGLGIFGAGGLHPDELDEQLRALDRDARGRSYGVDLVIPAKTLGEDSQRLEAMIPPEHRDFLESLYDRFGVPQRPPGAQRIRGQARAAAQMEVIMAHKQVSVIATALGPPPADIVRAAHARSIRIAGLVGAPEHARHHLEADTDILVAQGTEAGGHTGQISTLVLVPQVVDAARGRPVVAAGGIGDGRQLAAALALGAQAGWLGSIWLTTHESDLHPVVKSKLLRASSRDTVVSRCFTGKPVRQLATPWTNAWEDDRAPTPLPTPLQQMLVRPFLESVAEYGVEEPAGTPVGQVVGMMLRPLSVAAVIERLADELAATLERLGVALTGLGAALVPG
jgi:NAD(P)H-dependent flavin oxidoreductase YrpB (nitropropane dioxygenase family)